MRNMRNKDNNNNDETLFVRLVNGLKEGWTYFFTDPLQESSPFRRVIWGLVFLLLLSALFVSSILPHRLDVQVGEPAPYNIKSPTEFFDRPATEKLRQQAREDVSDVYEQDPAVKNEAIEQLDEIFGDLSQTRQRWFEELDIEPGDTVNLTDEQVGQVTSEMAEFMQVPLSELDVIELLTVEERVLEETYDHIESTLDFLYAQGIKPDNLQDYRTQMRQEAEQSDLPEQLRLLSGRLGENLLRPNLLFNAEETERRRDVAAQEVSPEIILRGQIIIPDGRIISSEDMVRLRDAGLVQDGAPWLIYAGSMLFSLVMITIVAVYLANFQRDIFESESRIVLVGLTTLLALFASRFLLVLSPYLTPIAAGTILLSVLLNGNTAVVVGVTMSMAIGLMTGGEVPAILMSLAGGTAGAVTAASVSERTDIMRSGLVVSVINIAVFISHASIGGTANLAEFALWKDALWGGANGILAAIIAIGFLPFQESFFGVLTPVKLLELSNPNHPLLRRLLEEAPGTYHHSMMVANLAESATEAVDGNSLLARVGAYYHDVGKARRPYFFVENQFTDSNPHDKLSPNLSALTVISHVREGLEMAEEEELPEQVTSFIAEHHGTTMASYFYQRALEQADEGEEVAQDNFRYPGPKPHSKETALVMLADAVEAAVRSLSRPTPNRVKSVVRDIIHERLEDGQLDRCDLTFRDLDRVAESFTQVLSGAFHHRVEYPETVMEEMEQEKADLEQEEDESSEN